MTLPARGQRAQAVSSYSQGAAVPMVPRPGCSHDGDELGAPHA
ncbi:hypothetical protein C8C93_4211 [Acidovorax sp. 93]|nr:hypothetical protein [Acidovorax sp. 93]RKR28926.1 hypothetical protein C8C93_4211 [Acidovorax sp. 93]